MGGEVHVDDPVLSVGVSEPVPHEAAIGAGAGTIVVRRTRVCISLRGGVVTQFRIRGFTRLTNAFSKKLENHALAVALHYMHYNFVRIHKTLRVTPAMAAGASDHVWDVANIVDVLEKWERQQQMKRALDWHTRD